MKLTLRTLVISVALLILRKIQVHTPETIYVGIFLCLSIVMIIIAIVRMANYRLGHIIDSTWEIFWQYMEACVSIMAGSMTIFPRLYLQLSLHSRKVFAPKAIRRRLSFSPQKRLVPNPRPVHQSRNLHTGWDKMETGRMTTTTFATFAGEPIALKPHHRFGNAAALLPAKLLGKVEELPEPDNRIHVVDRVDVDYHRASSDGVDDVVSEAEFVKLPTFTTPFEIKP